MDMMHAVFVVLALFGLSAAQDTYLIGAGMADVTGPVAEINMMGYANPAQRTNGIHLRTYSRAFVIANKDGSNKMAFVSVDACMISQLVKIEVIAALKAKFGDEYDDTNVLLSGTHTHSGTGAYHQYVLFEVTSLGFYGPSLDALVTGIVESIEKADSRMGLGHIYMNEGELMDSNINRSPSAYENNPAEERARYEHTVDKTMLLLRLTDIEDYGIGMINWFAVHPTSMNNTNGLISSDNKGYASILFEKDMNPDSFPGEGDFVAAFAQSNLGDVSPNTQGAKCQDTGEPCDQLTSTCDGRVQMCYALGPGQFGDMFESTRIIGTNQYKKAKELYEGAKTRLEGPVDFRLRYVDMTNVEVPINDTYTAKTCKPAMGYSFAAGTTDGPGAVDFTQGDIEGNDFWNNIRDAIKQPSPELIECHAPKPILLPTGEISFPYMWQPDIVDFQIFRIGQLVMLGVPGEFSTMAGRRLRETVQKTLIQSGFPKDTKVVVAGLANSYADYIVTYEEYQVQRYEGASTIYGPHTHAAMVNIIRQLAVDMAKGRSVDKGVPPPNLKDVQLSFIPPVIKDSPPEGKKIGSVILDAEDSYTQGDTVTVAFVAGNPRNSDQLKTEFMRVEKQNSETGHWEVVAKDSDWDTKFHWAREKMLSAESTAWLTWDIPSDQMPGTYRLVHNGHYKKIVALNPIKSYSAISSHFKIVKKSEAYDTFRRMSANLI